MPTAVAIRHRLRLDQVLPPQRDAIEAELGRGIVDQPLDRIGHFRPARRAIGLRRHGVGEGRHRAQRHRGDVVGARDETRALGQRRERHRARADIADVGRAHGEEFSVLAQRELHLGDEVAALVVGEEGLRARGGVFHRPADLLRRPQHQPEFHEHAVAGAEIAADVIGEDTYLVRLDAEHLRQFVLLPHRAAGAGIERVAAARLVVVGDRGAQLDRHAGDAADMHVELHDVIGLGERLVGRGAVAEPGLDRHVARQLRPTPPARRA